MHNLIELRNALEHLRTKDEDAFRNDENLSDNDKMILRFGRPYFDDAMQALNPSKAVRRMQHKTQVFTNFSNSHIRTRKVHSEEVESIAVKIAQILGLNVDLCFAQAKGHDIGHTPFGHLGEEYITKASGKPFRHEKFALVIARQIERRGNGLNLTKQTEHGILNHSRGAGELFIYDQVPPESTVTMYADKIAYLWSDINDIFSKSGIFRLADFPDLEKLVNEIGPIQRTRVYRCIESLCAESAAKGRVSFSDSPEAKIFAEIKRQMYGIYNQINYQNGEKALAGVHEQLAKCEECKGVDPLILLALLTDKDVLDLFSKSRIGQADLMSCSIGEILPYLRDKTFDWENP